VRTREDRCRRPTGPAPEMACGRGSVDCNDALATLAATSARVALRDRLVGAHIALAYGIAARYVRFGPTAEDTRQVAAFAQVQAVDRFIRAGARRFQRSRHPQSPA
jgi:hypothetical protein